MIILYLVLDSVVCFALGVGVSRYYAKKNITKILSHLESFKDWSEVKIRRETYMLTKSLKGK